MFKNKIKYSLLVGSLYNVKCNYIFNVYINGKKTDLTKKIDFITLSKINNGLFAKDGSFEFEGLTLDSYEKYKKEHSDYKENFVHYFYYILFYKEKKDKNSDISKCFAPEFKDKNGNKINDYGDFKDGKSGYTTINVYFIKEAEYKILNETEVLSKDFINSLGLIYKDKTAEESVQKCLENIKEINYCLTYKELLENLNLFDVYINNEKVIANNKYITPEEAKKLVLKPNLKHQKNKFLTLNLYNRYINDIEIPSYINLKYFLENYKSRISGNCYNFSKHEGLKFFANGKELKEDDIIGDVIDIKIEKYYVVIKKDTDKNIYLNKGEYVEVDKLDEFIKNFKEKEGLIGKKHMICANFIINNYFNLDYKKCFTNTLLVNVSTTEKEEELKEKPKEEPKEEQDKPTEEKPKGDNPTGDKPTDDQEVVKKTALIKECKDLVNNIKALDSSYNKTINASDSVENLESLKTELTNKLNELKKEKPIENPTKVPENPDPKNTEPTNTNGENNGTNGGNNSTNGGNTGKNNKKKMCENGCCKK